jgi:7,8-dihydro-6-hydroxymethylpterin-pyrophosphokinase
MTRKRTGKEVTAGGSAEEAMLHLGTNLGRHQAFGLVASRCTAADAECLRSIRQSGQYKRLGLSWERFCSQRAGISRAYADRLIQHLEEFGANYFRLAELMDISASTYRLIAGAVTDEGIEIGGETVPIRPDTREKIAAAVDAARQRAKAAPEAATDAPKVTALRKQLDDFLHGAAAVGHTTDERAELMVLLEEGERRIGALSQEVWRKTLIVG